jgi:hypothetical protein
MATRSDAMSDTAINVVRRFLASQGLPLPDSSGALPTLPAGFDGRDLLAEDFFVNCLPGTALGGVLRGRDAYGDTGIALMKIFDIETTEPQLHDGGDVAILTGLSRYTSKANRKSSQVPSLEFYKVKDGRIVSLDIYFTETQSIVALAQGK